MRRDECLKKFISDKEGGEDTLLLDPLYLANLNMFLSRTAL